MAEDGVVLEVASRSSDAPRQRLDRVAMELFAAFPTRSSARKAARRGELAVDGVISEGSRWVEAGSEVARLQGRDPGPVLELRLQVVFEDDHLALVIKPPGIATSGARPRTMERALGHNLRTSGEPDRIRPYPAHRLDAPTSGLVVVAKTRRALAGLGWAFQARRVHKHYRAVVIGKLEGEGEICEPIEGRTAHTRYRVVDHAPSLHSTAITRVDLWPQTGRTHQIRRHLAGLGHPVLGDGAYGIEGQILRSKGLFLFALGLKLTHPIHEVPLGHQMAEPPKVSSLFARERRRWERHHGPSGS